MESIEILTKKCIKTPKIGNFWNFCILWGHFGSFWGRLWGQPEKNQEALQINIA